MAKMMTLTEFINEDGRGSGNRIRSNVRIFGEMAEFPRNMEREIVSAGKRNSELHGIQGGELCFVFGDRKYPIKLTDGKIDRVNGMEI